IMSDKEKIQDSSSTTPPLTLKYTNMLIDITNHLKIIAHNVQELTNSLKFQLLLEYYMKQQYYTISLTETKLKNNNTVVLTSIN
ncbi:19923_t:CDS:1, partial [Gigaspora margarita]